MPFTRESARAPTAIGRVEVHIVQSSTTEPIQGSIEFDVLDASDELLRHKVFQIAELSAAQRGSLTTLANNIRARAVGEVL